MNARLSLPLITQHTCGRFLGEKGQPFLNIRSSLPIPLFRSSEALLSYTFQLLPSRFNLKRGEDSTRHSALTTGLPRGQPRRVLECPLLVDLYPEQDGRLPVRNIIYCLMLLDNRIHLFSRNRLFYFSSFARSEILFFTRPQFSIFAWSES